MKNIPSLSRKCLMAGFILLILFVIWTVLVSTVDTAAIGPEESVVGFSGINKSFHELTGLNTSLYKLTDLLEVIPLGICGLLGLLGLSQWIRRKNLLKVDADILAFGVYYIIIIAAYFFFEKVALNYRPEMVEGVMEPSYPSSTTLLVISVIPSAMLQINRRLPAGTLQTILKIAAAVFAAFMVISRLICGVHWLTDIIGGILLGAGLFLVLYAVIRILDSKKAE